MSRTESAGIIKSRRSEPKNFNAGAPGSDSKFDFKAFSKTGFLSEFDEYQDPYKIVNKYRNTDRSKIEKTHKGSFKPSGSAAKLKKNIEYISDPVTARPLTASNAESQKNFFTNPAKKGFGGSVGITLGKFFEYLPDPYERKKEHASKEWSEHKKKMGNKPFFITFKKRKCFTPDFQFFRIPSDLPEHKSPEPFSDTRPAFRPNNPPKKGYNCTLEPYPEHISDPPTDFQQRPSTTQNPWRYTTKWTTGPTVSVQKYNQQVRPHNSSSQFN